MSRHSTNCEKFILQQRTCHEEKLNRIHKPGEQPIGDSDIYIYRYNWSNPNAEPIYHVQQFSNSFFCIANSKGKRRNIEDWRELKFFYLIWIWRKFIIFPFNRVIRSRGKFDVVPISLIGDHALCLLHKTIPSPVFVWLQPLLYGFSLSYRVLLSPHQVGVGGEVLKGDPEI